MQYKVLHFPNWGIKSAINFETPFFPSVSHSAQLVRVKKAILYIFMPKKSPFHLTSHQCLMIKLTLIRNYTINIAQAECILDIRTATYWPTMLICIAQLTSQVKERPFFKFIARTVFFLFVKGPDMTKLSNEI